MTRIRTDWWAGSAIVLAGLLTTEPAMASYAAAPRQPLLGFSGHLVRIDRHLGGGRHYGMHVDSVQRGSPAARMGLERGDIVVTIDNVAFRSHEGYLRALRLAGQRPSLVIIDVRTGRMIRRSCQLPHRQETDDPVSSETYRMAIDLVHR
jgi:S1-C subfamily serine protease